MLRVFAQTLPTVNSRHSPARHSKARFRSESAMTHARPRAGSQRRRLIASALAAAVCVPLLAPAQPATESKKPAPRRTPTAPLGLSFEEPAETPPGSPTGLKVARAVGPAADAGLLAGDVIVAQNGAAVTTVAAFWDRAAAAGWRMQLRVVRAGRPLEYDIALGADPTNEGAPSRRAAPGARL
jgi:predicted metalloprotease with PDZ domain